MAHFFFKKKYISSSLVGMVGKYLGTRSLLRNSQQFIRRCFSKKPFCQNLFLIENRLCDQCDQMARLFLQFWAKYNNENLPNSVKCAKDRCKFLPFSK